MAETDGYWGEGYYGGGYWGEGYYGGGYWGEGYWSTGYTAAEGNRWIGPPALLRKKPTPQLLRAIKQFFEAELGE